MTLTFARAAASNDVGSFTVTRADRSLPWSNLQPFPHNARVTKSLTTTDDELTAVWSSTSAVGPTNQDIFFARRSAKTDPWVPPQLLAALATTDEDVEPIVRGDGCELMFARGLRGAGWDLYSVDIAR